MDTEYKKWYINERNRRQCREHKLRNLPPYFLYTGLGLA